MKTSNHFLQTPRGLSARTATRVGLPALLVLLAAGSLASESPGPLAVIEVAGSVSCARGGAAALPLTTHTELVSGDTLVTGTNAHLILSVHGTNDVLRLAPNSRLTLNTLHTSGRACEVHLNLEAGSVQGRLGRLDPATKFEVTTRRWVAGVRRDHTVFQMSADGSIIVLGGDVIVVVTDLERPTPHRLRAGQAFTADGQIRSVTAAEKASLPAALSQPTRTAGKQELVVVLPEAPGAGAFVGDWYDPQENSQFVRFVKQANGRIAMQAPATTPAPEETDWKPILQNVRLEDNVLTYDLSYSRAHPEEDVTAAQRDDGWWPHVRLKMRLELNPANPHELFLGMGGQRCGTLVRRAPPDGPPSSSATNAPGRYN